MTSKRGALSLLEGASLPRGRSREVIDLSLIDLPERPEGLRSFDCLIFNDVDTSSLSPDQKAALETWVSQGGRLVIGGGAGALHTVVGLPDSLLPFVPHGEVEVDALPGLANFAGADAIRVPGPFVVTTGETGEGRTLVAQDGLHLVREFLGLSVAWPGEGVNAFPLVHRHLGYDVSCGTKAIDPQAFHVLSCQAVCSVPNQSRTWQWSSFCVCIRLRQRKTVALVCYCVFGKATINRVAGEKWVIAQVFLTSKTVTALTVCITYPGYSNSVSQAELFDMVAGLDHSAHKGNLTV